MISQKTFDKLGLRGVEKTEPLSAKIITPLLEAASEETDETLQDMWATLLANAMDPNKDTSLQRIFIDTLRKMEPIDALVFGTMAARSGPRRDPGPDDSQCHRRRDRAVAGSQESGQALHGRCEHRPDCGVEHLNPRGNLE